MNNFPMIKDRRLKIGLVGCGRISKNHFGSIFQYPEDLELAAVCDIDGEVLSKATAEYKVEGYNDLRDMLASEQLDLAVLCTPSGLHPKQTVLAAAHGVHVVSEKPMATRYEDGLKMVEVCDEAGVRLFVVKQNRRNATLQLLKRAIDEKRFGAIKIVHLNIFWTRPQE
jgi:UDP-N-acetyl-2-amino-2-deoxyglucuronate dehydrogenase